MTLLASVMVVSFIISEWHLIRLSGQWRNPPLKRVAHVNVKVWRKTPKADLQTQPDHGEHDVINAAINHLMNNYNLEDLSQKLESLAQTIPKADVINESNPTVLLQKIMNEQRNRQNFARLQVLIGEAKKRQTLSHYFKIFAQHLPGLNSSAESGAKFEIRKQMPKFKFSSIRKSPMKK